MLQQSIQLSHKRQVVGVTRTKGTRTYHSVSCVQRAGSSHPANLVIILRNVANQERNPFNSLTNRNYCNIENILPNYDKTKTQM